MIAYKSILFILLLLVTTACITSLKTNKSDAGKEYSEDLSLYLPQEPIDSIIAENIVKQDAYKIDNTLQVTARLDAALLLVNNYNYEKIRYIEGITIQLYSGTSRSEAKEAQMRAYRHFPDSEPKIIFDQPNYKVRMEKFYSQLEAYPVFKEVRTKFGKAILVPTRIPVSKN